MRFIPFLSVKSFILKRDSSQISHRETNQQKQVLGKPFVTITKLTVGKNCTFDAKSYRIAAKSVTKISVIKLVFEWELLFG